jgi:hypothetical protein
LSGKPAPIFSNIIAAAHPTDPEPCGNDPGRYFWRVAR